MQIYLLEGSPKTLGAMNEKSSHDSREYLKKLGVIVKTETIVKNYDGQTVTMQNGDAIISSLVVWAAGVSGNVPDGIDKNLVVKGNRIRVDRFNKVEGSKNVYAIGDVAYMETEKYPHGHPQLAGVSIAQGLMLGKNLLKTQKNNSSMEEFEYHDKGTMATVGRNLAVCDLPIPKAFGTKLHLKGFFAWMIWMGVHIFLLLGVKNRLAVFSNWIYNYITYDQNLRLIFRVFKKPKTQ
jgi:NADH dehydrogenase